MKAKRVNKRGFTLLEMGIALGVLAIVVAMASLCFVAVQKFSNEKQHITAVMQEVQSFKTNFNLAFEDYQTSSFPLVPTTQPQNFITLGTDIISFQNQTLKQNETTLATFQHIQTATFETQNSLIKCTLTLADNGQQTLIFNKRI